MKPVRRAVIDVGTNSIKLLVADVEGVQVKPLREESRQTRLGQGFYDTHRLQPGPIAQTAEAVAWFAAQSRDAGARSLRIIATSAARDALNAAELTNSIQNACGQAVEIISGEQEADWAFQGVTTDPALRNEPLLLLDVGGGSTEFILGRGEHRRFCQSFPLGTVRLLASHPPGDPPTPAELAACREWLRVFLNERVRPRLEPALLDQPRSPSGQPLIQMVGTGGTASILGCMEANLNVFDREKLEATRLTRDRLAWHVGNLWALSLEERKRIVGLPPNRADVILTGAAIYESILAFFGFSELRISTRGLRFAALMDTPGVP